MFVLSCPEILYSPDPGDLSSMVHQAVLPPTISVSSALGAIDTPLILIAYCPALAPVPGVMVTSETDPQSVVADNLPPSAFGVPERKYCISFIST